jgi:hypothetical protein
MPAFDLVIRRGRSDTDPARAGRRTSRHRAGACHREERSDVATSVTERTLMEVATSLRSS